MRIRYRPAGTADDSTPMVEAEVNEIIVTLDTDEQVRMEEVALGLGISSPIAKLAVLPESPQAVTIGFQLDNN